MEDEIFPLEKILNVGVRDYCISVGKDLSDYTFFGVHSVFDKFSFIGESKPSSAVDLFQLKVPKNAEIVVNYRLTGSNIGITGPVIISYGVTLIPKEK